METDRCMGRWVMYGWMGVWVVVWLDGWVCRWMYGWVNAGMGVCSDRLSEEYSDLLGAPDYQRNIVPCWVPLIIRGI